jgi:hypothetical protein
MNKCTVFLRFLNKALQRYFIVENVIIRAYKWMKPLVTENVTFQRNISQKLPW